MNENHKLNIRKFLSVFLKLSNRKSLFQIFREIVYLTVVYRTIPYQYFGRYVFLKEVKNIKDYLPSEIMDKIRPFFNDKLVLDVQENKLFFNLFYGQFNLSLPKILMFNHLKMFVIGNRSIEINTADYFCETLKELMQTNSINSVFIKGTYGTWGGDKIYKIYSHQLQSDSAAIKTLYSEVIKRGFLFQETIQQHPEMERLNPSCMNTIRMDSFIDDKGNIEVMSAFLRMSINNSHVDNVSSGGCFIIIDMKTGTLDENGYLGITYDFGVPLKEHPITKVKFDSFLIPYFQEAKELVVKASSYMPGIRIIGWDIGIGVSGPVLIEANPDYGMSGGDMASHGFLSNPVFLKAWNEFNARKN